MKNLFLLLIFVLLCYLAYEKYAKPAAIQTPPDATTVSPPPASTPSTPAPTPTVAPTPLPTEEESAIKWLRENPAQLPSSVTLVEARELVLAVNGRTVGKTTLPAGRTGKLVAWDDESLTADFAGQLTTLGHNETDFQARIVEKYRTRQNTSPPKATIATSQQPIPDSTSIDLDLGKEIRASEIAEFVKTKQDGFKRLEGKKVAVSGIVESLEVSTSVGSQIAKITLRTGPNLPKVSLLIDARAFGGSPSLRANSDGLELKKRRDQDWSLVTAPNHPFTAKGVVSKYAISLEIAVEDSLDLTGLSSQ